MDRLALQYLINWKNKQKRKPLMIYGARQVGKTYLIKNIFGETYFKNSYIYINLKFDDDIRDYINGTGNYKSSTSSALKIMNHISLRKGIDINEDTLLIFDEIQEAMPAITALKDFKDNYSSIPVIASGSLIRIKLKRAGKNKNEKFFYPIGSIDEFTLYPVNFEEFLLATNKRLYKEIVKAYKEKIPLDISSHQLAIEYLKSYLLIGSLPENVQIYLDSKSFIQARKNLVTIYNDYLNDIDLYDATTETTLRTRNLFKNLYIEINRPHMEFRPSLIDEGKKMRDYEASMQLLDLGGVIYINKRLKERVTLPLREDDQSNYRLYFFDNGFLAYQSSINMSDFINGINTNMGVFFENYIATELVSYGVDLFYWKGKGDYEFEFVVKDNDKVVPIDVKKKKGSLSSINAYKSHNSCNKFVKVSENYYGYDDSSKILTIPIYSFFMYVKEIDNKLS